MEVQVFYEPLESFCGYRQVSRGVIALWRGTAEQTVEHLEGGTVVIEGGGWQCFHQV